MLLTILLNNYLYTTQILLEYKLTPTKILLNSYLNTTTKNTTKLQMKYYKNTT